MCKCQKNWFRNKNMYITFGEDQLKQALNFMSIQTSKKKKLPMQNRGIGEFQRTVLLMVLNIQLNLTEISVVPAIGTECTIVMKTKV